MARVDVQRHLAQGLDGVRVEEHAALAAKPPDFLHGLKNAGLIVRRHDAHQDRLVRERVLELVKIDQAVIVDGQLGHAAAALFQMLAAIEHGLVLA